MNTRRFFFAGLPASGKSTYLTAFWVYANGAAESPLKIEQYPQNNEYLTELQQHWFKCTVVPRTPSQSEREVKMVLRRASDNQVFDLLIPDLSGETFAQLWSTRYWPMHFEKLVDGSDGAIFFIHSQKYEDGPTLGQLREINREIGLPSNEASPENIPAAEWNVNKAPTQVQIVECLQLINEYGLSRRPFRLAIVISAWDLMRAQDPKADPTIWLQARMPLLARFLAANGQTYEIAVFGVSAQGGDYTNSTAALQQKRPYDRCLVVGPQVANEADITAPIQWLSR